MKYSIEEIEERVCALLDENIEIIEERVTYCDPGASLERTGSEPFSVNAREPSSWRLRRPSLTSV